MLEKPFSLEGELALITGGGSGIGLAIAQCLAKQGAQIAICGRRQEVINSACAKISPSAWGTIADVSIAQDRTRLLAETTKCFGKAPTILVNNAGINFKKDAIELSDEEFNNVIQTHLTASFSLSRQVAPAMIAAGHGNIINIGSMTSYMALPKVAAYASAKTAIIGLTRALACEWAKSGIRVNAIAPGFILTEMSVKALDSDPERKAKVLGRIMTGERGTPEDIGWAAAYLCSPAAKYVNGVLIPIDAGYSVGF